MRKLIALLVTCITVPAVAFALSAYGLQVPEPGNIALLGIGVMGLGLARHRAHVDKEATSSD